MSTACVIHIGKNIEMIEVKSAEPELLHEKFTLFIKKNDFNVILKS